MKTILQLPIAGLLAATAFSAEQELKLWYTGPARKCEEALPLGNGRLPGSAGLR